VRVVADRLISTIEQMAKIDHLSMVFSQRQTLKIRLRPKQLHI
jgi:hypothetical protein